MPWHGSHPAGRILSSDHTFKIAKKFFAPGGRMYEAVVLVMNEYGQVVARFLLQSKSHAELKPCLERLLNRYKKFGFLLPHVW